MSTIMWAILPTKVVSQCESSELGPPAQAMIRKTMRIGEVRTSIKLEPEFWGYLKEVADSRTIRLSRLVNDVASATPDRTNLASTLRTFCLIHAQLRWHGLEREIEQLRLAGNTRDLPRVLDACP